MTDPVAALALRYGMLTTEELRPALALQARRGKLPQQLGLILLSNGWLSETELHTLLVQQHPLWPSGQKV